MSLLVESVKGFVTGPAGFDLPMATAARARRPPTQDAQERLRRSQRRLSGGSTDSIWIGLSLSLRGNRNLGTALWHRNVFNAVKHD